MTTFQRRSLRDFERPASSLVIRNIVVAGRRTSMRLEPAMWDALQDIARRLGVSVHELVTQVDRDRTASSLTAAIRVFIVEFYRRTSYLPGYQPPMQPRRSADC
jgi:predicted DNA-binding ribbon-helix-helix protein